MSSVMKKDLERAYIKVVTCGIRWKTKSLNSKNFCFDQKSSFNKPLGFSCNWYSTGSREVLSEAIVNINTIDKNNLET